MLHITIAFLVCFVIQVYSLNRDNLNASAVLMTSTYACNSNRRDDTFKLWFNIANLNADCTSSVPCSKMAPVKEMRDQKLNIELMHLILMKSRT